MLKTQEHIDLIAMFEREFSGRFDKESKDLWTMGRIYQDGQLNEIFLAYRRGYAFGKAIHINGSPSPTRRTTMTRIDALETALNRMVLAHENLESDTEGKYPPADAGCIECTVGAVPDKYNTGLCAYHNAKQLLGQ